MSESWTTFSEIAEVAAAALRVFVLENPDSGIGRAEPFVLARIEDAAATLDECAERLAALEQFFIATGDAGSKVYETMVRCSAEGDDE